MSAAGRVIDWQTSQTGKIVACLFLLVIMWATLRGSLPKYLSLLGI